MENKYKLLIVVIVSMIIFGSIQRDPNECNEKFKGIIKENFMGRYGRSCNINEAKSKNFGNCLDCYNYGYCIKTGTNKKNKLTGQCKAGDIYGPYDNSECLVWYHNDGFSRLVHEDKLFSEHKGYV